MDKIREAGILLMVGKGEVRGVRAGGWRRRVGHVAAAGRHGRRRTGAESIREEYEQIFPFCTRKACEMLIAAQLYQDPNAHVHSEKFRNYTYNLAETNLVLIFFLNKGIKIF